MEFVSSAFGKALDSKGLVLSSARTTRVDKGHERIGATTAVRRIDRRETAILGVDDDDDKPNADWKIPADSIRGKMDPFFIEALEIIWDNSFMHEDLESSCYISSNFQGNLGQ